MRLAAECLLVGHADFLGIADANRGGRTINAEPVVTELLVTRQLLPHQRLLYRDTPGRWDELVHDGRRFTGFRHIGGDSFVDAVHRASSAQPTRPPATSALAAGGGVLRPGFHETLRDG